MIGTTSEENQSIEVGGLSTVTRGTKGGKRTRIRGMLCEMWRSVLVGRENGDGGEEDSECLKKSQKVLGRLPVGSWGGGVQGRMCSHILSMPASL